MHCSYLSRFVRVLHLPPPIQHDLTDLPEMPKAKQRAKPSRVPPKLSTKPPKPPKPPAGALPLVESLQHLVEDHERWDSSADDCLLQLHISLTRLRKLQSESRHYPSLIPPHRSPESFEAFTAWLVSYGLDPSTCPFRLSFLPGESQDNATLFATRPIASGELFVHVSEGLILTPDLSASSPLRALVDTLPALAAMPSLALVLQLLLEAANPASRFAPYVAVLPAAFTIPLANFEPADIASLAPSRAAEAAVKMLRATVRDYTHVYTALHRNRIPGIPVSLLSLDNYFWATSVTMTRQNELPVRGPGCFALVPVWDMCNHSPGPATTSVGLSQPDGEVVVESRAMRYFAEGEPITMCYGKRPNTELLLYSGFVQSDNENDKVPLDLLLQADAELAKFKAKVVLAKARIVVVELDDGRGWIVPLSIDASIDSGARALAVARVMAAGKDTIGEILKSGEGLPRSPLSDEAEEAGAKAIVGKALQSAIKEYEEAEERRPDTLSHMAKELVVQLHNEEKRLYRKAFALFEDS